jgi:hypothetical protein
MDSGVNNRWIGLIAQFDTHNHFSVSLDNHEYKKVVLAASNGLNKKVS